MHISVHYRPSSPVCYAQKANKISELMHNSRYLPFMDIFVFFSYRYCDISLISQILCIVILSLSWATYRHSYRIVSYPCRPSPRRYH